MKKWQIKLKTFLKKVRRHALEEYLKARFLVQIVFGINLFMTSFIFWAVKWGNGRLAIAISIVAGIVTLLTYFISTEAVKLIINGLGKIPGLGSISKIEVSLAFMKTLALIYSFIAFWISVKGLNAIDSEWLLIVLSIVVFSEFYTIYKNSKKQWAGTVMLIIVVIVMSQKVLPVWWDWGFTLYDKIQQGKQNSTLNRKNSLGSVVRVQGTFKLYKDDVTGGFKAYTTIKVEGIDWLYMVDASEKPKPYGPYNFVRVYEPAGKDELVTKQVWYRLDDGSAVNKLIIIPDKAEILPSKDERVQLVKFLTDDAVELLDHFPVGKKFTINGGVHGELKWPDVKDASRLLNVPQGNEFTNIFRNSLCLKYKKGGTISINFGEMEDPKIVKEMKRSSI